MAKHPVQAHFPPIIDHERFARNSMWPSAPLMKRLASSFNFAAAKCKKQILMMSAPIDNAVPGTASAFSMWPGYFRTGENTTELRAYLALIQTDLAKGLRANRPIVTLTIKDSTGSSTIVSKAWSFAYEGSSLEMNFITSVVSGLDPDTEYQFIFECEYGMRLMAAALVEAESAHADDSVTGLVNEAGLVAEAPIFDSHVSDLVTANNLLWQHNGAHLVRWCSQWDVADAPKTVATSYTNALDLSSTSVASTTPGWRLYTQYHNTVSRTTVPVKMAIRTDRVAGAGTLDVRLTDGTNSISITGIGDSAGGWSTTTANIPAQAGTKWDLQAKVSAGGTEHRISAFSLFEYEA